MISQKEIDSMPDYTDMFGCQKCQKGFIVFQDIGNKRFCSNAKCDFEEAIKDWIEWNPKKLVVFGNDKK